MNILEVARIMRQIGGTFSLRCSSVGYVVRVTNATGTGQLSYTHPDAEVATGILLTKVLPSNTRPDGGIDWAPLESKKPVCSACRSAPAGVEGLCVSCEGMLSP